MRKVPAFLLLLLFAVTSVVTSQSNADDPGIPDDVKVELRTFTKRFARRFQQTRNIELLVPTFFVPDFEGSCKHLFWSELDNKATYIPTKKEIRGVCTNFLDFFYLFGLIQILEPDNYEIENAKIFPKRIRTKLNVAMAKTDELDSVKSQRAFRNAMLPITDAMIDVRKYLAQSNYEASIKYKNAVAKLEKDKLYNYPVSSIFENIDEHSDDDWVTWFRKFGPETKAYSVGTPFGYALMIVKTRSGLRAFGLWAHPGSD